jgi:lipopolysaccharide transport system ATP-binding protein
MPIAIKAENLSKAYQLGEIGTGTISRDLERWISRARGKEDPFLRIGETNDRTTKGSSDVVWSLKDINFEIEQGDAVGIIGRNGAGKSTLLKILSRVTSPTTGRITGKGRIASLLEVGTGFHPELTGRENIYLNGAILGMRKREITRKFDEIVDFAGVERYIDTPVKRYSSGMYVRLAFAVAAHLESEILIVDEVLAVGDAEFQNKCLGKMGDISKGEGRTVLFVSHNMGAVKSFCRNSILLKDGAIINQGTTNKVIEDYLKLSMGDNSYTVQIDKKVVEWYGIMNKEELVSLTPFDDVTLELEIAFRDGFLVDFSVDFAIHNIYNEMIIHSKGSHINRQFKSNNTKRTRIIYNIKTPNLAPGEYYLTVYFHERNDPFLWIDQIQAFTVLPQGKSGMKSYLDNIKSKIVPEFNIICI